jgi:phage-related protein
MAYDGSIRIDTRIDSNGFNKGISAMLAGVKTLGVAIGVAFGITALVNFGKTAVTTASELSSAMIGLQSVVEGTGNSFTQAKGFINDYIKDGLVPITNATTAYKNLLMRGYDTTQIETVLTALKDSASFGRQASLTLGNAVQSATEGLKNENSILVDNAGVTKNVSMMWKDYAESIGTTAGALTKQQKIQAEVAGIIEESRFQVGDAAKLAGIYAGKVSALGVSFYNLKTAIGNSIIPIISQVIPYIKAAIDTLVIFFNKIANIMSVLFGVQIAGAIDSVTESTNTAADAQSNLADSTTKAGKAAKGALAAFDELNVLQMDEGDIGASTVDTPAIASGALDTSAIDTSLDELTKKVETFKENFLTFIDPVVQALGRLKDAVTPLGKTLWEGLKWAWDNILVPLGTWVIQDALPVFLDLLSAAATVLNSALVALQPLGTWLWENFLQPLAEWTGQAILDALGWLTDRLYELSDWIDNNQSAFQDIVVIIGIFTAAFILASAAVAIWSGVSAIGTVVTTAFGAAIAFLTSPITLVILAIAAIIAIIYLLIKYWPEVSAAAQKAWEWIVEIWGVAGEWYKNNVLDPIVNWFSQAWKDIKTFFSNAWQAIVNVWITVSTWFTTNVTDPIKNSFRTALDWVSEKFNTIFNGIKNFVKGIINGIIDMINRMLSGAVSGINGLINAANTAGGLIGGWKVIPTVSAPQIPRLATGAVIPANAPFAAILGDQKSGTNIEAPESLIRSIIREELGGANDMTISMPVYLDSEKIYEGQKKVSMRRGTSLISGATS